MSDVRNKNTIEERLLMSLIYENGARSTGMEARGSDADARVRKSSPLTLKLPRFVSMRGMAKVFCFPFLIF